MNNHSGLNESLSVGFVFPFLFTFDRLDEITSPLSKEGFIWLIPVSDYVCHSTVNDL